MLCSGCSGAVVGEREREKRLDGGRETPGSRHTSRGAEERCFECASRLHRRLKAIAFL